MSSDPNCTVYVGNLDERVSDRVLYDILIQAGRVVDLHIPRDKETDKPKGFAFAEYETEEIADYAVRLFSGLVTIYNRTLRFGISGQDKVTPNLQAASISPLKSRHYEDSATNPLSRYSNGNISHHLIPITFMFSLVNFNWSTYTTSVFLFWFMFKWPKNIVCDYAVIQISVSRGVNVDHNIHDHRRGSGTTWDGITRC
ncbi:hypothetical protein R6Q57_018427, partial [Mikania cordata]